MRVGVRVGVLMCVMSGLGPPAEVPVSSSGEAQAMTPIRQVSFQTKAGVWDSAARQQKAETTTSH